MEREVPLSTRVHPRSVWYCTILPHPEAARWKQKEPGACQHLLACETSVSGRLPELQSWKNDIFSHTSFPGMFGSVHVWVSSALLVSVRQAGGGEARPLTFLLHGVQPAKWSPFSGTSLAFSAMCICLNTTLMFLGGCPSSPTRGGLVKVGSAVYWSPVSPQHLGKCYLSTDIGCD